MKLKEIINFINPEKIKNNDIDINLCSIEGISYNSKTTKEKDIFVCLIGEKFDGHNFIEEAIKKGACAVVTQKEIYNNNIKVPLIKVKNSQLALAQVSELFFSSPSLNLNLIGITGTNGKTTVTHLVQKIFEDSGLKCGLIGTLGYRLSSKEEYAHGKYTTPQAPELQQSLREIVDKNINYAVMEVSSHALEQHRASGCYFNGAVLTNLTQDHLDYHITMENYFNAKIKLFKSLDNKKEKRKYAVINNDDKYAKGFKQSIPKQVRIISYGIKNPSNFWAKNIKFYPNGSSFECETPIGIKNIRLEMTGLFNIYNAIAALAIGFCENLDLDKCIQSLEEFKSVPGRFEIVTQKPMAIIDYAHTPDGLENILRAAKEIVPKNGNLICVFGCGGDRDATKRPQMGKIAEDYCDKIFITSDNPRTEDPQQVITDILTGIKSLNSDKVTVEIDRRTAIELAIKLSKENDVIVVAGKGHEDYQILKDKTIHFDDKEEVRFAFEKIKNTKL